MMMMNILSYCMGIPMLPKVAGFQMSLIGHVWVVWLNNHSRQEIAVGLTRTEQVIKFLDFGWK